MRSEANLDRHAAKKRIVDLLMAGGIGPEAPLSERTLAERIGIGRTPVREALRDLERDGIVRIEPTRGASVRRFGLDDLREIFELRYAVEALAASLAAMRGPTPRLIEIDATLRRLKAEGLRDAPARERSRQLGHELHGEVVASADNTQVARHYAQLRLLIEVSLHLTMKREDSRLDDALAEHLAITKAVLAGDFEAAQAAMREHLTANYRARIAILTAFPSIQLPIKEAS